MKEVTEQENVALSEFSLSKRNLSQKDNQSGNEQPESMGQGQSISENSQMSAGLEEQKKKINEKSLSI